MSKYSIITIDEVHSTNSYALENISFLDDKSVIFTSHQSLGRGRYNRKWISDDSDNIFLSIVLKPLNIDNFPFTNLTQYMSVVLCRLLEQEFSLRPEIKWPNDILVDGCKISGILAESYMEKNQIKGVVLGLGLNVNMQEKTLDTIDQKATSISVLKNELYDTETIVRKLMDLFFDGYDNFINNGFNSIHDEYISRCGFLGKNIYIRENEQKVQYFAKSIDDNGLLIVTDELNNECKIITGDVLC